jgi:hypothetical protein
MLDSISWSEFLGFTGAALAIYYAVAGLLLYGEEIKSKLLRWRPSIIDEVDEAVQIEPNESISLLGPVASELGPLDGEVVQSSEIQFREHVETPDEVNPERPAIENSLATTITGMFNDVQAIAEVVSGNTKDELAEMFRTLLERYPQLLNYRDSLSQFIVNSCNKYATYPIGLDEVNSWWPEVKSTQ